MDDHDIVTRIDNLVAEEHELRSHAGGGRPLTNEDRARLDDLEVKLAGLGADIERVVTDEPGSEVRDLTGVVGD